MHVAQAMSQSARLVSGMYTHIYEGKNGNTPCGKLSPNIIGRAYQARLGQSATKETQLAQTDRTHIPLHPPTSHIVRVCLQAVGKGDIYNHAYSSSTIAGLHGGGWLGFVEYSSALKGFVVDGSREDGTRALIMVVALAMSVLFAAQS